MIFRPFNVLSVSRPIPPPSRLWLLSKLTLPKNFVAVTKPDKSGNGVELSDKYLKVADHYLLLETVILN
jgi:hypothetical protein